MLIITNLKMISMTNREKLLFVPVIGFIVLLIECFKPEIDWEGEFPSMAQFSVMFLIQTVTVISLCLYLIHVLWY